MKQFFAIIIAHVISLILILGFINHHSTHPEHGNVKYINYAHTFEKHEEHGFIKRVSYDVKCSPFDSCG